jgi:hypothetical protein
VTRGVPITVAAYAPPMVDALLGPLLPFLHAGDEVDLVSGNHNRPLSLANLNEWSTRLAHGLPQGVGFAAHTSSLENVRAIVDGADSRIRSVLLDYEPNWDPTFTWDFPATLTHFGEFAELCRAGRRRAVAYPTGRPLREGPLQVYGWDYGALRSQVDEVYPQTQHWAAVGPQEWASAISRLRAEWQRAGHDPGHLTVQVTLGDKDNGLPASTAIERFRAAQLPPTGRLYLWWAPNFVDETVQFLRGVETP